MSANRAIQQNYSFPFKTAATEWGVLCLTARLRGTSNAKDLGSLRHRKSLKNRGGLSPDAASAFFCLHPSRIPGRFQTCCILGGCCAVTGRLYHTCLLEIHVPGYRSLGALCRLEMLRLTLLPHYITNLLRIIKAHHAAPL